MKTKTIIIHVGDAKLFVRTYGSIESSPLILLPGAGNSSANWDEALIQSLVEAAWFVIAPDARDSGQSSTAEPGKPTHDLRVLMTDVIKILDGLEIAKATVFGVSQGAAIAQLFAIEHPERLAALALFGGSPGGPGHAAEDLPGMTPEIGAVFVSETPGPDWNDEEAVIKYLVDSERPFAAHSVDFDAELMLGLATASAAHARNLESQLTNPFMIDAGPPWRDRLKLIAAPAVVLHGAEDPLFPVQHGEALATEIPGASFVRLDHTGHGTIPREHYETFVATLEAIRSKAMQ